MSRGTRPPQKDMYWFAHGGPENEKLQRNSALLDGEEEAHSSNSPTWNLLTDRRPSPDEQRSSHTVTDGGSHSSGPSSLERDDRLRMSDKRIAVEERRKQLWEAEQERNEAVLRKHLEREAALEARRNASRSTIAFAFGSSIPRHVDTLQANDGVDGDIMSRSFTSGSSHKEEIHNTFHDRRSVSPLNYYGPISLVHDKSPPSTSCTSYSERRVLSPPSCLFGSGALIGDDVMSRSMNASMSFAPRGRRKNDLMPTVPYDRTATPRVAISSSTRKRSVSMTRLDQLALPRKHYLEANKASSSASSANSSMLKDNVRSPTRPLSSASENSGGSGRVSGSVTRRIRSSPRKPRPVSIAGTLPEQRLNTTKPFEVKVSPTKRSYTPIKQSTTANGAVKSSTPKSVEKFKQAPRLATPPKLSTPKSSAPKPTTPKSAKQTESKLTAAKQAPSPKTATSKPKEKKSLPIKKKPDTVVCSPLTGEVKSLSDDTEKAESPPPVDSEVSAENEKNNAKRIISEEEAKAALAEKRRLAREQAEREAELERQRLEELRLEEEERLRQEEEDHRKMEEEQMRLLEEHRRQEEEKLRKAIEDQEQKEEEERAKRDEEMRMKAEQEKKAKEEAEKQRLELEEKLRKEEEERAERKKRLEKIMSRTRGKSSGTSPSGSVSGSDQLDSGENPQEGFSSGANSLDSNEAVELPSEQASIEDHKAEIFSAGESGDSLDANPTYEIGSENESLNSNDLMMPASETASQDNSLVIVPEKDVENPVASLEADILGSHQNESNAVGLQESSQVEVIETKVKIEEMQEDGQEAMSTSMIAEHSIHISQEDTADVHPEVSLPGTQLESHLENKEIHVDGADMMVMPQFSEDNFSTENQLHSNSNLLEEVESQQNLKESDMLKISSDETATDLFSHESINISDGPQIQHVTDAKDSSITQDLPEELNVDAAASEMFEYQAHSSISSDIKLPDPIYETSEDGSISSEKHQMFGMQEEFAYSRNQENVAVLDDVFSQQVILPDPESVPHGENPFEMNAFSAKQNPFSAEYSVQRSDVNVDESSAYDMNGRETANPNVFDRDYEIDEENVSHSSSTMIDADMHKSEKVVLEENHHSIEKENIPTEIISDIPVSQPINEFTDDVDFSKHTTEENKWESGDKLNEDNITVVSPSNAIKTSCENIGDNPFLEKRVNEHDSFTFFNQGVSETHGDFFKQQEVDDVTFIKENNSGACIGIISSIDHDQISNNLSKSVLINEQLKNNFESATMTDSEDNSSLDSNLSQVMTMDGNGKDTVENHVEITESTKNGFSNGEKHSLFDIDDVYNDSLSKAGVNNFHASEMFSNSHKFESSTSASEQMSELHGYVQLGGNGILSVDHSQNNIFETANPIDYGKVSPDPFLVKGSSGNPFLLQDDQKQVLMAPDFLN